MSIQLIKERAKRLEQPIVKPDWVSNKNRTSEIYTCMCDLENEKRLFIKAASKKSQFKKKSNYQILISEISRRTGLSNPTIGHTSAYSKDLVITLKKMNNGLYAKMELRLKKIEAKAKKGIQAGTKDEAIEKLRETEKQLKAISNLNASQQVSELVSALSLPIKRKLGLD